MCLKTTGTDVLHPLIKLVVTRSPTFVWQCTDLPCDPFTNPPLSLKPIINHTPVPAHIWFCAHTWEPHHGTHMRAAILGEWIHDWVLHGIRTIKSKPMSGRPSFIIGRSASKPVGIPENSWTVGQTICAPVVCN